MQEAINDLKKRSKVRYVVCERRSISCGNHPRARRVTMATTTPRMRKTAVRFLNGLS